jgi:hypothetical protein
MEEPANVKLQSVSAQDNPHAPRNASKGVFGALVPDLVNGYLFANDHARTCQKRPCQKEGGQFTGAYVGACERMLQINCGSADQADHATQNFGRSQNR